jgi:putative membrane protein
MMHDFGFDHGIGMGLGWLFWILLIGLAVYSISKTFSQRRAQDPMDILKERYAKGEIDKDEFESKKRELST